MEGSKRKAKRDWTHGRGPNSFRAQKKFSLKMNKKFLNRKARREKNLPNGNGYRKLAKDKAYEYLT